MEYHYGGEIVSNIEIRNINYCTIKKDLFRCFGYEISTFLFMILPFGALKLWIGAIKAFTAYIFKTNIKMASRFTTNRVLLPRINIYSY